MEEYIKKLLEQVRFQKAHKAIEDEIRLHIEDQINENISEGMDKEIAEKKAVEDMGDPVDVGIELDKVHRPQLAWELVVATLVVTVLGIILHISMSKQLNWGMSFQISKNHLVQEGTMFVFWTILGVALMLLIYLIDFTTIAKYSKIAGFILLAAYFVSEDMFLFVNLDSLGYDVDLFLTGLNDRLSELTFLMIPLYAGILYKYKGRKYGGLIKAVIWIMFFCLCVYSFCDFEKMMVIPSCMLVQLTIAINKEWIKVHKIPATIAMWSLFALPFMKSIKAFCELYGFEYEEDTIRPIIRGSGLFGRGIVPGDDVRYAEDSGILQYLSTTMGIGVAIAVVAIVISLIVYALIVTTKTKNQLGLVMGIGCMFWLVEKVIFNIAFWLGMNPDRAETTFLPFISGGLAYDGLIASYVMLGIVLSIYKYKDAYAEHVDISLRAG